MPSNASRRARWLDLFGLGGLQGSERETREHLARRVALYFLVLFVIYLVRYFGVVVLGLIRHNLGPQLVHPARMVHLAAILFSLVVSRLPAALRTVRQLGILELAGTVLVGCAHAGSLALMPPNQPTVDLALVLVYTQTLVARAAIVPSTTMRTAAVGAVNLAILCAGAFVAGRNSAPTSGTPAWFWIFRTVEWGGISLLLTAIITQVIYGLRRRYLQLAHLGQYTLEEKIGEGGMGIVYRASHGMLRRPTAIKLLPPERAGAAAIQRFEREVQLTATLVHPNTVAIYDFGRTPEGTFYYAMEYLDGIDLERLVTADGPQPAARVVYILGQVCSALGEAHGRGLVHRDVKPANVVLCQRGGSSDFAKVVDFGLVKDLTPGADESRSQSETFLGTPLYLAPEAIGGSVQLDGRSDLYSVGALAYFLLTGKPVFEGGSLIEICAHHLHTPPAPPSTRTPGVTVPASLELLVLSCLEKAPAQRPASAEALAAALEALDGVPRWTSAEASRWWAERGEAVRKARVAGAAVDRGATVEIDLQRRAG